MSELEPIIKRSNLTVTAKVRGARAVAPERSPEGEADRPEPAEQRAQVHAGRVGDDDRVVRRAASARSAIAVTDTGVGIPDEDQVKVFEDFRQLDSSPGPRLRRHRARPVDLPAPVADARRHDRAREHGRRRARRSPCACRRRRGADERAARTRTQPLVLVVEDYQDAREMYAAYLQFSGYRRRRGDQRHRGDREDRSSCCRTSS